MPSVCTEHQKSRLERENPNPKNTFPGSRYGKGVFTSLTMPKALRIKSIFLRGSLCREYVEDTGPPPDILLGVTVCRIFGRPEGSGIARFTNFGGCLDGPHRLQRVLIRVDPASPYMVVFVCLFHFASVSIPPLPSPPFPASLSFFCFFFRLLPFSPPSTALDALAFFSSSFLPPRLFFGSRSFSISISHFPHLS